MEALRVEKHRLRYVMPYADGKADPLQWFVFRGEALVAGPFTRAGDAWAAADRERGEFAGD